MLIERGRYSENQGVHFLNAAEIRRAFELSAFLSGSHTFAADMLEVGLTFGKAFDFFGINIKAQGATSGSGVSQKNREANLAEPDDSNCG